MVQVAQQRWKDLSALTALPHPLAHHLGQVSKVRFYLPPGSSMLLIPCHSRSSPRISSLHTIKASEQAMEASKLKLHVLHHICFCRALGASLLREPVSGSLSRLMPVQIIAEHCFAERKLSRQFVSKQAWRSSGHDMA